MDVGQWAKWIKDMYAIKPGTEEPAIIVADHEDNGFVEDLHCPELVVPSGEMNC